MRKHSQWGSRNCQANSNDRLMAFRADMVDRQIQIVEEG